jgi:hypothetical protein
MERGALAKETGDLAPGRAVSGMSPPEWDYWRLRISATVMDAITLSLNFEPREILSESSRFRSPSGDFHADKKLAWIESETLQPHGTTRLSILLDYARNGRFEMKDEHGLYGMVNLADTAKLMRECGFDIPPEFAALVMDNDIPEPDVPNNLIPMSDTDKLDPRVKNTLLVIIAALCEKAGTDPRQKGLAKELEKITERLKAPRSAERIGCYLEEAANLTK